MVPRHDMERIDGGGCWNMNHIFFFHLDIAALNIFMFHSRDQKLL